MKVFDSELEQKLIDRYSQDKVKLKTLLRYFFGVHWDRVIPINEPFYHQVFLLIEYLKRRDKDQELYLLLPKSSKFNKILYERLIATYAFDQEELINYLRLYLGFIWQTEIPTKEPFNNQVFTLIETFQMRGLLSNLRLLLCKDQLSYLDSLRESGHEVTKPLQDIQENL